MADPVFPYAPVEIVAPYLTPLPGVEAVVTRPLTPDDPNGSVGISALDWFPVDNEIGADEPTICRYMYRIETLVKIAGDREEGQVSSSLLARSIRSMLYRNTDVRIRLGQLREVTDGRIERVQKWGIQQQRYASNHLSGTFLFVSTTDWWVETETV